MPTYEYECKSCGHRFEKSQSMLDKPLRKCPECAKGVRRVIGNGAGIIFKGSGFYATDYRKSGYSEKEKSEKSPAAAPCANVKPSCQGCPSAS
ncbi:MAG: zinc ribbon domain-containing protein [Candidatus Omnitrophota bacterium]|nr:zinc ribbon domain-containing protein [Candidatus Omnitrophota bacterium]